MNVIEDLPRDPALSAAYNATRVDAAPSAQADATVLAYAARAVGAGPRSLNSRSWMQRWAVPMGLAATLVLSVSMIVVMRDEAPEAFEAKVPARTAPVAAPPVAPAPAAPVAATTAAEPPTAIAPTAEPAKSAPKQTAERRRSEAIAQSAPKATALEKKKESIEAAVMAQPTPAGAAFGASAEKDVLTDRVAPAATAPSMAPPSPAPVARSAHVAESAAAGAIAAIGPADAWLKHLEALRLANRFDELRAELKRFRIAHPNVTLPDALKPYAPTESTPSPPKAE